MVDLRTNIGGLEIENPFILASGPLSHDGNAILRAHRAGAGAVVTKTISRVPAVNPVPHIAKVGNSLMNGEKWSDLPYERWIEVEIPLAKDGGATVIASVGLSPGDVAALARSLARAGADAIEVVSYDGKALVPMVREAAHQVDIPVFAKVSANWTDVIDVARACLESGATAITAIDSIGPALRINPQMRAPLLASGYGWLTGQAIFPIALRIVSEIAIATGAPIVGTGGIWEVDNILEMMMAGAHAVGICSLPILRGVTIFSELAEKLSSRLHDLGYHSLKEAIGAALPALRSYERIGSGLPAAKEAANATFVLNEELCSDCGVCVSICPYQARVSPREIDPARCRLCGLCSSACPRGALELRVGEEDR